MDCAAMDPYGRALLDFFNGDTAATVAVRRDDGLTGPMPAGIFFRTEADFSPIERSALDLCHGLILDIGAGAGCHSLALQKRGMHVRAIDISPQLIDIMSKRGVMDTRCVNAFEFREGRFDTLLLMLHGIGMMETLSGLDRFLLHAHDLITPGGKIVFDSLDVRRTDDPRNLAYHEANRKAGRYFGEIRMRFEYRGDMGPYFGWLHVDPETLAEQATKADWECRVVLQQEDGNYLAQLTTKK